MKTGTWEGQSVGAAGRGFSPAWYLLLVVGMAGVCLVATGQMATPPGWMIGVPFGLFALALVHANWGARFPRPARVDLAENVLTITTGKRGLTVHLSGARLFLSKHFAHKDMSLFAGTLMDLDNQARSERIRILGMGTELEGERYSGRETTGTSYEAFLPTQAFRELLEAVEQSDCQRVGVPSLRRETAGDQGSLADEMSFEAYPLRGALSATMLVWMGGIVALGALAALISQLVPEELVVRWGAIIGTPAVVLLIAGMFITAVFASKRRGELLLDRSGLIYFINGKPRRTLRLPFRLVQPIGIKMSARTSTYYCGPAVHLEDRAGKKLTILIGDPKVAWAGKLVFRGSADVQISADAGKGLRSWLAAAGADPGGFKRYRD